jgi:hypothetical protein
VPVRLCHAVVAWLNFVVIVEELRAPFAGHQSRLDVDQGCRL